MAKRIIIIGATSGIGLAIANQYIGMGWQVGVAGRREELLDKIKDSAPSSVESNIIDVTLPTASESLAALIAKLGGMDIFLLVSGIGKQNPNLDDTIESKTIATNVLGFTRMVDAAYLYFKENHLTGKIAVISSIAGTKGIGIAASYSASKRYQNTYIEALEQLARIQGVKVNFCDIRPGFVSTDLLDNSHHYPLQLTPDYTASCIIKGINANKSVATIDWKYRIIVTLWQLIPRWIWKRLPIKN